jgi:hypothetical protein
MPLIVSYNASDLGSSHEVAKSVHHRLVRWQIEQKDFVSSGVQFLDEGRPSEVFSLLAYTGNVVNLLLTFFTLVDVLLSVLVLLKDIWTHFFQ